MSSFAIKAGDGSVDRVAKDHGEDWEALHPGLKEALLQRIFKGKEQSSSASYASAISQLPLGLEDREPRPASIDRESILKLDSVPVQLLALIQI